MSRKTLFILRVITLILDMTCAIMWTYDGHLIMGILWQLTSLLWAMSIYIDKE